MDLTNRLVQNKWKNQQKIAIQNMKDSKFQASVTQSERGED